MLSISIWIIWNQESKESLGHKPARNSRQQKKKKNLSLIWVQMCAFIDWTILADSGKGICHIEKCRSSNLWIFHLQLNCCYNSTITKQNDCVCVWCYCTDLNIMRKSLHSGLCHMAHHCQWTLSVIIWHYFVGQHCQPTMTGHEAWGLTHDWHCQPISSIVILTLFFVGRHVGPCVRGANNDGPCGAALMVGDSENCAPAYDDLDCWPSYT